MFLLIITTCGHFFFGGFECRERIYEVNASKEMCEHMARRLTGLTMSGFERFAECREPEHEGKE